MKRTEFGSGLADVHPQDVIAASLQMPDQVGPIKPELQVTRIRRDSKLISSSLENTAVAGNRTGANP